MVDQNAGSTMIHQNVGSTMVDQNAGSTMVDQNSQGASLNSLVGQMYGPWGLLESAHCETVGEVDAEALCGVDVHPSAIRPDV